MGININNKINNMKKKLFIIGAVLITAIYAVVDHYTTTPNFDAKQEKVAQRTANVNLKGISIQSQNGSHMDVAYLASIGVNCIRIQIKPADRAKRMNIMPQTAFTIELGWAERIIDECKVNGITSIVSFNDFVLDPNDTINENDLKFWTDSVYLKNTYNYVKAIAVKYKSKGSELYAYEFMSEPALYTSSDGTAIQPPRLEEFYNSSLFIVRSYDPLRCFVLTPGPWAKPTNYRNFNGFQSISDTNVVYNVHMYMPHSYTHQGIKGYQRPVSYPSATFNSDTIIKRFKSVKDFQARTGHKIIVGEFQAIRWAPNADQWVKDVLTNIKANGWSWCYFSYKPNYRFWDPFFAVANPTSKPQHWYLKNFGTTSDMWKYMINEGYK
jgi:endoglucanase